MKINEVEAVTGIPKKSIRYYEAEGLLRPERDSANGYRRYTDRDVEVLRQIKLFRKLDMPVDEIRRVFAGELTAAAALERQQITLTHRNKEVEQRRAMCEQLIRSIPESGMLDALAALECMDNMEKQGVRFHDFTRTDYKKKIRAVWFAAIGFALVMLALAALIWWANDTDPLPVWGFLLMEAFFVVPAIGVFIAGHDRVKEIKGGEEDDLSNY